MAGAETQIELSKIAKRYGSVDAVLPTDLRIAKGSFCSLLGPSGCGKTTLLKLIAGFEQPTGGEIRIAGRSVAGTPPEMRNIGLVFQNYALFPHMTVAENIGFGLDVRGVEAREIEWRVAQMLDLVELPGIQRRRPSQLSGGQQQRVALARALIVEPSVLLLDEPFGALDKNLRQSMQLKLVEIQRKLGVTTIFVTHDQEEALIMSDEIAVMSAERHTIEQLGSPRDIYERPISAYVSRFIGHANIWRETLEGEAGDGLLRTASGFVLRKPTHRAPADAYAVCVRPEKIDVSGPGETPPHANRLEGVVRDSIFVGELTIFRVETRGGRMYEVRRLSREADEGFVVGTDVVLSWAPRSMLLLA